MEKNSESANAMVMSVSPASMSAWTRARRANGDAPSPPERARAGLRRGRQPASVATRSWYDRRRSPPRLDLAQAKVTDGRHSGMADLSDMLGDVYGDDADGKPYAPEPPPQHEDAAGPAPETASGAGPTPEATTRAPAWADE